MINSLTLCHYYHKNFNPLKSITATNDHIEIVESLANQTGKTFDRFRNYDWYIKNRIATEKWLYDKFIELYPAPKLTSPLYFVLGESQYLKVCYGDNARQISIPLNCIDEKDISFTLSDSMSIHVRNDEKKLYSKKTLIQLMQTQNICIYDYIRKLDEQNKYIEAQIWSDKYFEK